MTRIVRLLTIALVATISACVGGVWLAIQRAPLVMASGGVSVDDVQRARSLMKRNDPRRDADGTPRVVTLTQQDLTLLTQYAASRWRRATTRVQLRDGSADLQLSLELPANPFGRWLNLDASVQDASGLPRVDRLRVGRLPVPSFAADPIARWLLARLGAGAVVRIADEMVHTTTFSRRSVAVAYTWQQGAAARVRDVLIAPEDLARLGAYTAELAALVDATPQGQPVSLTQLLAPLVGRAAARSVENDAVGEYRAVLATLALYVTGRSLGRYVRSARSWRKPAPRRVTLAGREDLAKHFLVSAVVAAQTGGALADAVGQTKEVDDSHGGSGFSFVDIAADRAGTRFGELVSSVAGPRQDRLGNRLQEQDFMPSIDGLPEFMTAAQFAERFGGIGEPRFAAMMRVIEARIAALPLYQP